jgi:hypothetical protein
MIGVIDGDGKRTEYEDGNVTSSPIATYPTAFEWTEA